MAINCEIETQYGAGFNYHKIVDVHIIVREQVQLRITVDSWLNKQARIEGKKPVRTCNIIDNMDFALTPFYQVLKMKFPGYTEGNDDFDDEWKGQKQSRPQVFSVQCDNTLVQQWQDPAVTDIEEIEELNPEDIIDFEEEIEETNEAGDKIIRAKPIEE